MKRDAVEIDQVVGVIHWATKNIRWIEPILKSDPECGWECESMKGFVYDGETIFECLYKAWSNREAK